MCPPSAFTSSNPSSQTPSQIVDPSSFVPDTEVSKCAFELATKLLHPAIFNHSIRVYQYAKVLAEQTNSVFTADPTKHDLLFTACILHDIGTTSTYNGSHRFEIEGGDAAVALLSRFGVNEEDKHQVWIAIALHSTPQIAERINELSRLVREAVLTDFGRKAEGFQDFEKLKERLEVRFKRDNVEKILGDAVVEQAKERPGKAPMASWPGVLYKSWLAEPEWDGVNKGF